MRRSLTVIGVVVTLGAIAASAGAAHYCTAATGTFISIPLPANPAAPERTHLYWHDRTRTTGTCMPFCPPVDPWRETEGQWTYLENGLKAGYNSGGVALVPVLNATGSADIGCGAVMSDDGLSATPKAGADDVVL